MAGNYLPHTLVVLDARDLSLVKIIPVVDRKGKTSRVSAVYDAAPRKSFVAALKDIPEVWELPCDPKAPPVYKVTCTTTRRARAWPRRVRSRCAGSCSTTCSTTFFSTRYTTT